MVQIQKNLNQTPFMLPHWQCECFIDELKGTHRKVRRLYLEPVFLNLK